MTSTDAQVARVTSQVRAIAEKIAQATRDDVDAPNHLLFRLEALVGGEELLYVDSSLAGGGDFLVSGQVFALTSRLVLLATCAAASSRPGDDGSTVSVVMWGRDTLQAVSVDVDVARNPDRVWDGLHVDWRPRAAVTLHYAGRNPLALPLQRSTTGAARAALAVALPELVRDLPART